MTVVVCPDSREDAETYFRLMGYLIPMLNKSRRGVLRNLDILLQHRPAFGSFQSLEVWTGGKDILHDGAYHFCTALIQAHFALAGMT